VRRTNGHDYAMTRIRILVVDDSVLIRKLLSDTLSDDRALEVVGTASDGRIGLAKIAQLQPDLVTLDVEMPVMNGLETLAELRKLYPKLPVVMFSTITERGATSSASALGPPVDVPIVTISRTIGTGKFLGICGSICHPFLPVC
jgi:chemotaxis response regulator CheB